MANGGVQKDICVLWYQVAELEVPKRTNVLLDEFN